MAELNTIRSASGTQAAQIDAGLRAHMNKVYGTMSVGMFITAAAAWAIAGLAVTSDPTGATAALREGQYLTGLGEVLYTTPSALGRDVRTARLHPVRLGCFDASRIGSHSPTGLLRLCRRHGRLDELDLLVFTAHSITQTFLVTAIAFAGLSLWGYTTKKDLSGMGTFFMMGVIGLVVAMVINIFLQSPAMMYAISAIGILIFAGLTAYYTQDIKNTYVTHAAHGDQEWLDKAAIDGSLSLYISFLNMFQFLLMFMGQQE